MLVVRGRPEHGLGRAELLSVPFPLVALLPAAARGVQGVVVGRVRDVQLVRIDADDRAVLVVQLPDAKGVLAAEDHIVIELVPTTLVIMRDSSLCLCMYLCIFLLFIFFRSCIFGHTTG